MPFQDEEIRFEEGGDSGENEPEAIQPIGEGETVWDAVFNRSPENLRKRTEILRGAVKYLNYLADYDRGFILSARGAKIICTKVYSSPDRYRIDLDSQGLYFYPALTPGKTSGGRTEGANLWIGNQPYAGVLSANDLALVAHRGYTGMRGYADAESLAEASAHSIGSDDTSVELVGESRSGGPASIQVTVTGTPRRRIRIAYGNAGTTPTTLADLITFINNDTNLGGTEPGGTFGLMNLLYASTTCSNPSAITSIPDFPETYLQGGYDAEEHYVPKHQIDAFFDIDDNLLRDGECMALFFAGDVEASPTAGGRRQSLPDLPVDKAGAYTDNTQSTVTPYGNLFNTGREPEKVPGALPFIKMVNGEAVFIDGTRLADGKTVTLGENYVTLDAIASVVVDLAAETAARLAFQARLSSVVIGDGAAMIAFRGSVAWNDYTLDDPGDGGGTPTIPAGTVESAFNSLVLRMGQVDNLLSGARRIGSEEYLGVVSVLNEAKKISLLAGSLRQHVKGLLDGLNTKVSETGWHLKGLLPVVKTFPIEAPSGGGTMLTGEFAPYSNLGSVLGLTAQNLMSLMVQPISYDDANPNHEIKLLEACNYVAGPGLNVIKLIDATIAARWAFMRTKLPLPTLTLIIAPPFPIPWAIDHVLVFVAGVTVGSTDVSGYYRVMDTPGLSLLSLANLDGTLPDLSTWTFTSATLTFLGAVQTGSSDLGTRLRAFHAGNGPFASIAQMNELASLLEAWHYDTATAAPVRNLVITPGRVQLTRNSKLRDSEHILLTNDFVQLNGDEAGSVPEVSTSHKHDLRYAGISHFYDRPALDMALRALNPVGGAELSGAFYRQRGAWATGESYLSNVGTFIDVVFVCEAPYYGYYSCTSFHTAGGTFAGDIANWQISEAFPVQDGYTSRGTIAAISATDNHVFDATALFELPGPSTNIEGFELNDLPHMKEVEVEVIVRWRSPGITADMTPYIADKVFPVIRDDTIVGSFTQQLVSSTLYASHMHTVSTKGFFKDVPPSTEFFVHRQRMSVILERMVSPADPVHQHAYIAYKCSSSDGNIRSIEMRLIKVRCARI
jgi:hypothetical protein